MHLVRRENLIQMPCSEGRFADLTAWLKNVLREIRSRATVRRSEPRMHLLETMSLGGRKQLLLVSCCGERFLVGANGDAVQTIVPLEKRAAAAQDSTAPGREEPV